jgi:hypothetical protein
VGKNSGRQETDPKEAVQILGHPLNKCDYSAQIAKNIYFLCIFKRRVGVCCSLFSLCRPFMIFERCVIRTQRAALLVGELPNQQCTLTYKAQCPECSQIKNSYISLYVHEISKKSKFRLNRFNLIASGELCNIVEQFKLW